MRTGSKTLFISWLLGLLTLVVLILNRPEALPPDMLGLWVLFVILIAFGLNINVLISSGEINPAHLFAIMAYFILGHDQQAAEALWAVAAGALLGGLIRVARAEEWLPRRRVTARSLASVAEIMAQLTLSLLVAEVLYLQVGGQLPLIALQHSNTLPLFIFSLGFVLIYALFFVLRVRLEGRAASTVLAADRVMVFGVIILPIPFAILGALIHSELDTLPWMLFLSGLVLALIGLYGLGRTQFHYRQQVGELRSISAVSQALRTSLELDSLLSTIHLQVASLLEVDSFIVALLDPIYPRIHFPLAIQRDVRVELEPREPDTTLLDYVITRRQPLLIEQNVAERAALMGLKLPEGVVYSWLGVPLQVADRALGAIAVASYNPGRLLGESDQRLLMNIAAQAGIAIENAQFFEQAQARALQLATLNSISALLTGTLSPEKVINLVAGCVVAVANCDAVAVYLHRDRQFRLVRNVGLSDIFDRDNPPPLIVDLPEENHSLRVGRQPVVVTDAHGDDRVDSQRRAIMDRENKRSWMEFLLISGDVPQGIIVAYYDQPRTFTGDEIELLRAFTVQAALAINNAQLYTNTDLALGRRISQLQALYDIGQELTAILNLQKVFDLVVERALGGTRSDAALVMVGAEDRTSTQVVAHRGYPAGTFENTTFNTGLTVSAYDTGQPFIARDVSQHLAYRALNPGTHSQLSVPIRREEETLGVITVESQALNAFTEDDITYVTQLANQAAIAIDNARLFKRVAEGRDRLQAILDSLTEGVLLIDSTGVVALANPRIERMLALKPSMLVGRLVDDLLIDTGTAFAERLGYREGELRLLMADLRAGEWREPAVSAHFGYTLDEPEPITLDRNVVPVRDESGSLMGLLLIFVDQTEEQELARAREDLSQMIVHDLRGPLTAISASFKLLNDLTPANSELTPIVQRTTDASMRAVRKLLNLVDSLLDISKMESGQMTLDREAVALDAIASNVALETDSLTRELDITLAVDIPRDLPLLYVDRAQIERVLLNLVDNALKFTPADGTVTITAYIADTTSDHVWVEVSDTGPGVPDDYKERLFNRFVQIKGVRGRRHGTGLGLAFCRMAVEAHGGEIRVRDNPGGGAVFAFTLPTSDALSARQNQEAPIDDEAEGPLL